MKPTVLVATTARWFPTARLVVALARAGFAVDVVCPSGHVVGQTGSARHLFPYRGLAPLTSLADAISSSAPDLVLPGDDLATTHLHVLHRRAQVKGDGSSVCSLIERSLGAAESYGVVTARARFIQVAEREGIRVPKTEVIHNVGELKTSIARMGFPIVLKADGSSGGDGVKVVHGIEDAEAAFRTLQAPPLLARAAKRSLLDRDVRLLKPSLFRRRSTVNAQAFISGREATSTVACWQGHVVASLNFEVINKVASYGHATVLRLIESAEMSSATGKIVSALGLSGVHGFDFILETETARVHLIEMNPRSTQVGHLTLGNGRDIPAALYSAVSGQPIELAPKLTEDTTIALFPQEWIRDPASPFLRSAYHDVPWDKPDLIRACVRARRKQRAWYSEKDRLQAYSVARLAGHRASVVQSREAH